MRTQMRNQKRNQNSRNNQFDSKIKDHQINEIDSFSQEKMAQVDYFPHLENPSYEDTYGYLSEYSDYSDYSDDEDEGTLVGYGVEYDNEVKVVKSTTTYHRHIPKQFYSEQYTWNAPSCNIHFPKHQFPALVPSLRPEKTVGFNPKTTKKTIKTKETPQKNRVCNYHFQCRRANCTFAHTCDEFNPVECKFGKRCRRKYCNWFHPTRENKTGFITRMNIDFTPKIEVDKPRAGTIVYAF